ADERERPYRRLPLASGASAAGRPGAAGAPARPSPAGLPGSRLSHVGAGLAALPEAGQPGWSSGGASASDPKHASRTAGYAATAGGRRNPPARPRPERREEINGPLTGKLRLAGALMLLVLPLAVALWAYAGWDSGKQQAKTDARLQGWLQTAVADYSRILRDAEQRAAELGSSPRVQSALARRDRRQLARLAGPNLFFELGRSAESATPGAVS